MLYMMFSSFAVDASKLRFLLIFIPMQIKIFTFNPVGEQTYVLSDDSHECVIVDPGCFDSSEEALLDEFVASHGLKPVAAWFTHLHFDHCWGAAHVVAKYGVPVFASADDEFLLTDVNRQMTAAWGLPAPAPFSVTNFLTDGQMLRFGNSSARVITTPGHTPGGVSFFFEHDAVCLTGDTLFRMSIGRTDFPLGSLPDLVNSVRCKLLQLPEDTVVLPGHGAQTRIGDEMLSNPYINEC